MFRQLPLAIALLALIVGVGALPWSLGTSPNSLSSIATPSFTATNSTNLSPTKSPPQCDDIHSCRTLYDIVQTCVLTLFACVWVAVHRNIPPPPPSAKPALPKGQGRHNFGEIAIRTAQRIWIFGRGQSSFVIVIALLLPDAILAMALVQSFHASGLWRELELAREESRKNWEVDHPKELQTMEGLAEENDALSRACMVARLDEPWTKAHAFLVIMGGYQFYDKEGPRYALDPRTVVQLVREGKIAPPTAAEVSDSSKGDVLSKGFVIVQTLWFVTQCIARGFARLPVTNLEAMTLAYTLITVAMYIAWWKKPLNVACVIRVSTLSDRTHQEQTPPTFTSIFWKWVSRAIGSTMPVHDIKLGSLVMDWILAFIDGTQDDLVKLELLEGVPTFWTGRATSDVSLRAHTLGLCVAVSFGAVHCITWSYAFPSLLQQRLWRWSTVAITGLPVALVACLILARMGSGCVEGKHQRLGRWGRVCGLFVLAIGGPVYGCARGTLFVISFTTLRSLPIAAYRIVQWTEFIPHI